MKIPEGEPSANITIPDKWTVKTVGEGVETTSPDGAVHFLVTPGERKVAESMGEVMRYIRATGGMTVDPASLKRDDGKLNGMDVKNVSWNAKDKKGEMRIRYHIVSMPPKRPLLLVSWASPEAEKKHERELKAMLQSFKKI